MEVGSKALPRPAALPLASSLLPQSAALTLDKLHLRNLPLPAVPSTFPPLPIPPIAQAIGQSFSLSDVDRSIARWIWRFQAFNVLLGGIIGSTLASQV